ncbi:MAG: hypothetical protein JXA43_00930 [Candidatus Diapherotrites archaeon]|nr:hypothetical protein [Candidatus Diapherotrites archaeon]
MNILRAEIIGIIVGLLIGVLLGAIGAIFEAPVWAIAIVVGVATGYLVGKMLPFIKLGQNMFNITMHVARGPPPMMLPIAPQQKLEIPVQPPKEEKKAEKKKSAKKKLKGGVDVEIK